MAIRVFLVDDHEVVRRGLASLIDVESDIEVVGEAGGVADALARIPAVQPQVVILDVRLPDGDGIELCREIKTKSPEIGCLMLTSFSDDEALFSAILAGAAGYLLKQIRSSDLIDGIRRVHNGESLLDPAVTARVLQRLRSPEPEDDLLSKLSPQERKILNFIAEGMTNREIANEMFLAEKTVKNYVSNMLSKLGMGHRSEAAAYAARLSERKRLKDHD
ncbi:MULTISPECIES: response regulator transcription factor [Acidithrix]|uniref:Transcriptional regulatory protein DevR (DosR) n=1 Tax=Acidithrix ferrooxidans TaxID=1280514 RepID=A0A0D8HMJ2_9ACTN|nr:MULTISPECIES: response regulator transcription factor [Acidithrix]KJF18962.1 transcriptional regulatory protein DevR (DosR) [Acidithrix ferrooxidans]